MTSLTKRAWRWPLTLLNSIGKRLRFGRSNTLRHRLSHLNERQFDLERTLCQRIATRLREQRPSM
jgi:hypothetical protein